MCVCVSKVQVCVCVCERVSESVSGECLQVTVCIYLCGLWTGGAKPICR